MTPDSNDIALLEKTNKTPAEYIELQTRAFADSKTQRVFEKETDTLRHAYEAGDASSDDCACS